MCANVISPISPSSAGADAPRILIAASGSGGHLFPALHIARAILSLSPGARIEFIGSGRPLEEKLIVQGGFIRHTVRITGVKQRGLRGVLDFSGAVPRALRELSKIFADLRPDVVVGVGGYVSVLPVTLARLRGIPTWIHEAEMKPGLANAFLGLFADRISVAFENAALLRKGAVRYTGHPIRGGLAEVRRAAPREKLSRVLILGGSQGAAAFDGAVKDIAPLFRERAIEVWHQCRSENVERVNEAYRAHGVSARVDSFIDDMAGAFSWSDLIISRSGASAIMELSVINVPTILVPYPFAQGNHQLANAQVLGQAGKALIVEEGERFGGRLAQAIEDLLAPSAYRRMVETPYEARSVDAARRIAAGVIELRRPPV